MKRYLLLWVCFIASFAYAQNPGNNQKKLAYKVVDELVTNYMQYSKINDLPSKEALKQLFSKNATIPNEIVPAYYYNDKKEPEKIPDVSIDDYFSKLKEVYPQGYGYVKFLNSAISYNGLSKREVSVVFQKSIGAYTFTGLQLEVLDTIRLHILLSPDYKSALISKIDLLGHTIKFVNDDDADFVSNEKDKCKTQRGLNSPDGCLTTKEIAIAAAEEKRVRDSIATVKAAAVALAEKRRQDSLAKVKAIALTEKRVRDSIAAAKAAAVALAEKRRQDSLAIARAAALTEKRVRDSIATVKAAAVALAEKKRQDSLAAAKAAAAVLTEKRRQDSLAKAKAIALAVEKQRDSLFYLKQIKALEGSINRVSAETQQAPPRLWGSVGGAAGAVSATLSDNVYKAGDFKAIVNPASTFDAGKFSQVNLGLHYFFGPKANIGIGAGLNYNMLNGNAGKDNYHAEYTETDAWGSKFTQLVSSRGVIHEKAKIKNLSVPVTLVYKGQFDQKFGFSIEGGLLYNLSYKSTASNTSVNTFDLEAEYLFNGTAANGGDYSDPIVPYSKGSWLITRSQAAAHGATDNGTAYLKEMRSQGFYVGAADTAASVVSTSNFKNGAIGFIIKPSISYHFNETTSLSAGFLFTSVTFKQKENTYRLFDKNRTYNTLLNGVNSMSNRNTGFHITFSKALFYNPGKAKNARAAKMKAELSDYRKKLAQLQAN